MAVEQVLYNITGSRNLETANIEDLSTVVNEHPYFAPAQFLLALKQKQAGSYSFNYQIQKASLYFSNPLWLQYQLADERVSDIIIDKAEQRVSSTPKPTPQLKKETFSDIAITPPVEETVAATEHIDYPTLHRSFEPVAEDINLDHLSFQPTETTEEKEPEEIKNEEPAYPSYTPTPAPVFTQPANDDMIDYTAYAPSNNIVKIQGYDAAVNSIKEEAEPAPLPSVQPTVTENYSNNTFSEDEPNPILSRSVTSFEIPTLEAVKQMLEGKTPATYTPAVPTALPVIDKSTLPLTDQELKNELAALEEDDIEEVKPTEPVPSYSFNGFSQETNNTATELSTHAAVIENYAEQKVEEVKPAAPIPSYSFNGFSQDNNDKASELNAQAAALHAFIEEEEEQETTIDEPNIPANNISSVLSSQMADFKKPLEEDAKLDFEKEPYYTIDYFASQGIKVDLTKQPQDKLTVQLRRFTDWLKQVKGADPNPNDLGTDPELEKAIANIAKTSIASREIVTETMADVFIKQGKIDKAIQLYIKLSFLDPHKSAYFADKIQQLKGI